MGRLLRRLRYLIQHDRHTRELAEEMDFHRSMLASRSLNEGEAERAFGNMTLAREDARDVWMLRWLDALRRDVSYGLRTLRREPTFAVTAVLTLAIGVLATITVFTVADGELWKPLPFPQPRQLVAVDAAGPGGTYEDVSGPDFLSWRAQSRLTSYAAVGEIAQRILRRDTSESVLAMTVSANFFSVLRSPAALGRDFDDGDEHGSHVAILSNRAWKRRFDGDPGVVGRTVTLDRDTYAVVGVRAATPLGFLSDPDIYLCLNRDAPDLASWTSRTLDVIGRLNSGVTNGQGLAELEAIQVRNAAIAPAAHAGHAVALEDLRNAWRVISPWRPLYFFLAAAGLVLLLACGNAAHLLLTRALRRQREFAIRGALGGGRTALARQMLVEGALIAAPGVSCGVLLSSWTLAVLAARIPSEYIEHGGPPALDVRSVVFAAGVAVVSTLALALAPLVFTRRIHLNPMLGHGGRTAGSSPRQTRVRQALVVAQIAIALVLLTGAGLFLVSFARLSRAPLGFEPDNRLAISISAESGAHADDAFMREFANRVLDRARAVPGVGNAAIGSSSPLGSGTTMTFAVADSPRPAPGDEPWAIFRAVSPAYFKTLGIRIIAGRPFTAADAVGAPRVVIVNERLARRFFPSGDAIGSRVDLLAGHSRSTNHPGEVEIVGVAANAKDLGMNEADFEDIYVPFAQTPSPDFDLVVRTAIGVPAVADPISRAVETVDPSAVTGTLTPFTRRVDNALRNDRFNMLLIVAFAGLAVLLAAVGVYGTTAYAMEERTKEFGVRVALGASPGAILRAALWQTGRLGVAGGALGLAAALITVRLVGSALYLVPGVHGGLLYGVNATNPAVLTTAIAAIVGIVLLAGAVPARRAMRVDPAVTLRE